MTRTMGSALVHGPGITMAQRIAAVQDMQGAGKKQLAVVQPCPAAVPGSSSAFVPSFKAGRKDPKGSLLHPAPPLPVISPSNPAHTRHAPARPKSAACSTMHAPYTPGYDPSHPPRKEAMVSAAPSTPWLCGCFGSGNASHSAHAYARAAQRRQQQEKQQQQQQAEELKHKQRSASKDAGSSKHSEHALNIVQEDSHIDACEEMHVISQPRRMSMQAPGQGTGAHDKSGASGTAGSLGGGMGPGPGHGQRDGGSQGAASFRTGHTSVKGGGARCASAAASGARPHSAAPTQASDDSLMTETMDDDDNDSFVQVDDGVEASELSAASRLSTWMKESFTHAAHRAASALARPWTGKSATKSILKKPQQRGLPSASQRHQRGGVAEEAFLTLHNPTWASNSATMQMHILHEKETSKTPLIHPNSNPGYAPDTPIAAIRPLSAIPQQDRKPLQRTSVPTNTYTRPETSHEGCMERMVAGDASLVMQQFYLLAGGAGIPTQLDSYGQGGGLLADASQSHGQAAPGSKGLHAAAVDQASGQSLMQMHAAAGHAVPSLAGTAGALHAPSGEVTGAGAAAAAGGVSLNADDLVVMLVSQGRLSTREAALLRNPNLAHPQGHVSSTKSHGSSGSGGPAASLTLQSGADLSGSGLGNVGGQALVTENGSVPSCTSIGATGVLPPVVAARQGKVGFAHGVSAPDPCPTPSTRSTPLGSADTTSSTLACIPIPSAPRATTQPHASSWMHIHVPESACGQHGQDGPKWLRANGQALVATAAGVLIARQAGAPSRPQAAHGSVCSAATIDTDYLAEPLQHYGSRTGFIDTRATQYNLDGSSTPPGSGCYSQPGQSPPNTPPLPTTYRAEDSGCSSSADNSQPLAGNMQQHCEQRFKQQLGQGGAASAGNGALHGRHAANAAGVVPQRHRRTSLDSLVMADGTQKQGVLLQGGPASNKHLIRCQPRAAPRASDPGSPRGQRSVRFSAPTTFQFDRDEVSSTGRMSEDGGDFASYVQGRRGEAATGFH